MTEQYPNIPDKRPDTGRPEFIPTQGMTHEDLLTPPPHIDSPAVADRPEMVTYANAHPELPQDLTIFHLAQGIPPIELSDPIKRKLKETFDEILESNAYFNHKEAVEAADAYVRNRFKIDKKPYIGWSTSGSDEILERVELLLSNDPEKPKINVFVVGPSFQNPYNFIRRRRVPEKTNGQDTEPSTTELKVGEAKKIDEANGLFTIETPLGSSIQETISLATEVAHNTDEPSFFMLCNPSSPTGEVCKLQLIETLVEVCAEKGHTLLIDEAAEIGLSDRDSAVQLTMNYPNVIVARSFSKLGLPKIRVGYAVMSPNVGEKFEKLRRPYDLDFKLKLLTGLMEPAQDVENNNASLEEPDLLTQHLEDVREKTREIKETLITALENASIPYLPTGHGTLLITIDGLSEGYYDKVIKQGIEVVPGSSFRITHSQMSDRYVRMIIPPSVEDVPEVVGRLKKAILEQ